MRGSKAGIVVVIVGLVLAACGDPTGIEPAARAGVLQLVGSGGYGGVSGDPELRWTAPASSDVFIPGDVLVVPDTVTAGEPFTVTVRTIGLNGCWAPAGQEVRWEEHTVELRPRDAHSGARVCTEILQLLTHTSELSIPEPGEWVVRVRGRRVRASGTGEEPVAVEKTIVVQ